MTSSRIRLARIAVPAAAALLTLAACSSTAAESSSSDEMMASPSAEMMESDAMESESMESGSMESGSMESGSMESGSMESEAMESEAMESDAMSGDSAAMSDAGSFIDYAAYESAKDRYDTGTVVLFFNASWCPTCQETVGNLEADPAAIPAGLTVVSVDYDTADELKQKYGVTTQHTFVQVDGDGSELAKWTGSADAEAIAKKTV